MRVGGTGGLSRRQRPCVRGLHLGALILALALIAVACSSDETTETTVGPGSSTTVGPGSSTTVGPGSSTTVVSDVRNPGVLVHAWGGEPETFDPARAEAGNYGDNVVIQVYEFLVDFAPGENQVSPSLAAEVPTQENGLISADGLVYTFPIRQGVKFHDGTDLTAEDVKYSWDRVITMNLPEGQASTLTDVIASTRVVDDYTFEVTLQEPAGWFLSSIVYSTPAAIVSQDAVEANGGVVAGEPNEWMDTHEAGTGPHMLVSWARNEQLVFERFVDYWGEPAALDVRVAVVPDISGVILGLRAGDWDLIEPQPEYVEEVQADPAICVNETGFLNEPLHAAFNLNIAEGTLPAGDTIPTDFFWDKRVRQAFNYAFDYDAYIEGGLSGHGGPATYLPPGIVGYDPDMPIYTQDLARAEELFREAGWWDEGFTLSVLVESGSPTFVNLALILKDSLETLNPSFVITVYQVSESQFDEAHGMTPFEYAMWVKNADPFHDASFYMGTYFHPDGEWGQRMGFRNGYENPDQIADLIDRAAASTDPNERTALYDQVVPLLFDDPMWVWGANERNLQIYQCWVENFSFNPNWTFIRWRFLDKG